MKLTRILHSAEIPTSSMADIAFLVTLFLFECPEATNGRRLLLWPRREVISI